MRSCEHNDKQVCMPCWETQMKREFPDIEKAWND